MSHLLIVFLCI